jgi:hypothetical protein
VKFCYFEGEKMSKEYITIKLALSAISDNPRKYRARIEESPAGASRGAGVDFELPDNLPEDFPAYLQKQQESEITGGTGAAIPTEDLGKFLFEKVFQGDNRSKYETTTALANDKGLRVRLVLSILSPDLIQIPWEFLHDGKGFLLRRKGGYSIIRVIDEIPDRQDSFGPFKNPLIVTALPQGLSGDPGCESHLKFLKDNLSKMGINDPYILKNATRDSLADAIKSNAFDAFYFLGHGEMRASSNGVIKLVSDKSGRKIPDDNLDADILAFWIANAQKVPRGRLVYLNSCSTAETDPGNTFAGVAQRLILDGNVAAVVAMQAPILKDQATNMATSFLEQIQIGKSPEQAVVYSRTMATNNYSWGIPVIYTQNSDLDAFDKNRIACLLDAEIGKSRYVLSLPLFRMGILAEDYQNLKIPPEPSDIYKYPGDTLARTDFEAAKYVLYLITKIADLDEIVIADPNSNPAPNATHRFFFGSRSQRQVQMLQKAYLPKFRFHYSKEEWSIEVLETKKKYTIKDPSRQTPDAYNQETDYGIIEKIKDPQLNRIYFIISGLGSRATEGCGYYLYKHWEELLKEYTKGSFGILLEFPGGLTYDFARKIYP